MRWVKKPELKGRHWTGNPDREGVGGVGPVLVKIRSEEEIVNQ